MSTDEINLVSKSEESKNADPASNPQSNLGKNTENNLADGGNSFSDVSGFIESIRSWFIENNPLYLISVFLMFWGLYLVSIDNNGRGPGSLFNLIAFYLIQNVYEIIMLGMALYLLVKKINSFHGKLLLFFIILFMSEVTMYQSAISSVCKAGYDLWISAVISLIYLLMAAVKFIITIKLLKITLRVNILFYAISAFAIIYYAPQYVNLILSGHYSASFNAGWWELYYVWFVASLIMIPVILKSWYEPELKKEIYNEYIGNESIFYKFILLVPFIALPIQVALNAHPDLQAMNPMLRHYDYCFVPYIFLASFFLQSLFYDFIEENIGNRMFEFWVMIIVFSYAVISRPINISYFESVYIYPHRINLFLMTAFNIFVIASRKNQWCLAFFVCTVVYYSQAILCASISSVYNSAAGLLEKYRQISAMAKAAMLIAASFIMLGAGFAISVIGNKNKKE